MTNDEAKFMLQGYRPNGQDADNEAFGPALAQAARDPMLHEWFEREQAFDAVIVGKLREIPVPAGLRDSILAGTKLSSPVATTKRAWWRQPWGIALAAAAAAALLLTGATTRPGQAIAVVSGLRSILRVAKLDATGEHPAHGKKAYLLGEVGEWLENPNTQLGAETFPGNLADLKLDGCRTIDIAGREVLEICFRRDTGWYHVYLAPRESFEDGSLQGGPLFQQQGQFASATWADDKFVYLVTGTAGIDALRGLL